MHKRIERGGDETGETEPVRIHPAIVGATKKAHVVIGEITRESAETYAAPIILPPREDASPLNPYQDHVKATTMFDALSQLFIGSRRQFHEERSVAYRLMLISRAEFRRNLTPGEEARVSVSYGKARRIGGTPIFEVSGTVANKRDEVVMKTGFLMATPTMPKHPVRQG